jgi:predicted dinucleotide-binding enzyme
MRIGIVGAGHIGGTLARHFVDATRLRSETCAGQPRCKPSPKSSGRGRRR